ALLQRFVSEVGLPLNDRSRFFHLGRGGEQGLVNFRCRLREHAGRNRRYTENDQYHTSHSVTSNSSAWNSLALRAPAAIYVRRHRVADNRSGRFDAVYRSSVIL